jgi:hypothetical protein
MEKIAHRPLKTNIEVWKCEDMQKLVREAIDAHVKDASSAKSLEKILQGFYAYAPASKIMILEETATTKEK